MRPHQVHVTHLVMGLVFLGICAIWALAQLGLINGDGSVWVFPMVLVVAGGIGLAASVVRGIRDRD